MASSESPELNHRRLSSNVTVRPSLRKSQSASVDRPPTTTSPLLASSSAEEAAAATEEPPQEDDSGAQDGGANDANDEEKDSGGVAGEAAAGPSDVAMRLWKRFSMEADDEDDEGDVEELFPESRNKRRSLDYASIMSRATQDDPHAGSHADDPTLRAMARSRLGQKSAPWRKLRNVFLSVADVGGAGATKKNAGRSRVSGENMPSPEFIRQVSSTIDAQKEHEPGWQLRMLASSEDGDSSNADLNASLSELANALRSGVSQHLANPDWLPKLHAFRSELELRGRGTVAMSDFRQLLRVMFKVTLGDMPLRRIFDSLDSARRGRLEWRTVLDFMTPMSSGDKVTCPSTNVVTCIALSADCSVVAFGGIGFVRAINVASR
jgi:hypothetical protein